MKLNLGCGADYKEGWINLDIDKKHNPDVVHDLNHKMPFPNDRFKKIGAYHILEHIDDSWKLMCEIHRVGKKDCLVQISVPHFSSINAWADMQHKRGFALECFKSTNIIDKFKLISYRLTFPRSFFWLEKFANWKPRFYETYLASFFGCYEIKVNLMVTQKRGLMKQRIDSPQII